MAKKRIRKKEKYMPKGKRIDLIGILLPNRLIYVPEHYIGQRCIVKYEDTSSYKCEFKDGFIAWIMKSLIKKEDKICN